MLSSFFTLDKCPLCQTPIRETNLNGTCPSCNEIIEITVTIGTTSRTPSMIAGDMPIHDVQAAMLSGATVLKLANKFTSGYPSTAIYFDKPGAAQTAWNLRGQWVLT